MSNWVCRREWDTRSWEDTRLSCRPSQYISRGHYTRAHPRFIVTWTQSLKFAAIAIQVDTCRSCYTYQLMTKDLILTGNTLTERGKNECTEEQPLPYMPDHSWNTITMSMCTWWRLYRIQIARIYTAENIGAKGQRTISPNFGDPKINECRV